MVHIHSSLWAIPWFSKRADLSCQRPLSVFKIFYPDFQKKKTAFRLSAEPNRRQSFLLNRQNDYSSLLWYLTASSIVRIPLIFFTSFTQRMWSLRMVASSISLMAASILSSFAISTAILKSNEPNDSLMFLRCPSWIPTSLQIKNLGGFPDKDNRSKSEWLYL